MFKTRASARIMTTSAERPNIRQPPNERLLHGLKLPGIQESAGNPVDAHHIGARQQTGTQATIVEAHWRKWRAYPVRILPQLACVEISNDIAGEIPDARQVRRHDGGIIEVFPAGVEYRFNSGIAEIRVKAKRGLVRPAFGVGLSQVYDAESIDHHVRRAQPRREIVPFEAGSQSWKRGIAGKICFSVSLRRTFASGF